MRRISLLVPVFILLAALSSCRTSYRPSRVADVDDPWAKQAWMNKAARALLYGSAGLSTAEADQLMPLSKDEIVEKFMSDPRFYETALDFNLFFLGQKHEKLRYFPTSGYKPEVFDERAAAAAALELSRNGDYFVLFNWKMPYALVGPPGTPRPHEGQTAATSDEQRREYWLAKAKESLDTWIGKIQAINDVKALCAQYLKANDEGDDFSNYLVNYGLADELSDTFNKSIKNEIMCGVIDGKISQSATIKQDLLAEAMSFREALALIPAVLDSLRKLIKSPADLNILSPKTLPILKEETFEVFSTTMWSSLANSSTNYNRKRAAYILKTFFCDDLTPLNIAAPASHSDNKHASEPACQACHYKLDPMAGFFRSRGIAGLNFESVDFHIHDDQLKREGADLTTYLASWKAAPGSTRKWDVGYIRSTKKESLNSYGDSLSDLFQTIREAPESKTCLTKRLAEYMLGIDQIYDGRWIDSLAKEFKEAAKPTAAPGDSSRAFKKVVKSLVLSRTFSAPDPVKGKCYDFAPNSASSGLPCEVAYVVDKNCSSCHSGEGAPKGLDLSAWKALANGASGFAHVDERSGQQLAPSVSLARIACSLSPTETCGPVQQMPFNKEMDAVERATLFKWVQNELAGGRQ